MRFLTIEVWKTKSRRIPPWTWRLLHFNGQVMANAAETYDSKSNAVRAARRMHALLSEPQPARVVTLEEDGARVIQVPKEPLQTETS